MLFYLVYFTLSPLFFLIIIIAKTFNQKIYKHEKNINTTIKKVQLLIHSADRKEKKILLFHAASAGEFEQLKPILNQINRKKYIVIQSFTSPTIYEQEHDNNLFDACCYHPYDIWWRSLKFFSIIKPDAYIITRHDIWPGHLYIAKQLKIKSFYINANIHEKSLWIKSFMLPISKSIFKNLYICCVPSKKINNYLSSIFEPNKIIITGDSRFDQINMRYMLNKDKVLLPRYFSKSNNIIFGSYDMYDEPLILNSLKSHFPKGDQSLIDQNQRIILVPHEINKDNIKDLMLKLKKMNFNPNLFTSLSKTHNEINILIIDVIGILADIYKYGKLAYVGAGFGKGVHSVIEPAVYSNVISYGPNIELLDEAQKMYEENLAFIIKDTNDMLDFFKLLKNKDKMKKLSSDTKKYIIQYKNVSKNIINIICNEQ